MFCSTSAATLRLRFVLSSKLQFFAVLILLLAGRPAGFGFEEKMLTPARIFAKPGFEPILAKKIAWSSDSEQIAYLLAADPDEHAGYDLWVMDVRTGARRILLPEEKLDSLDGLESFQWSPDKTGMVLASGTRIIWFDLKARTLRVLVSGNAPVTEVKISPDAHWIGFVRQHNIWLLNRSSGRTSALTRDENGNVSNGELAPAYGKDFDMGMAYWWAPDSSAIAFLRTDRTRVLRTAGQQYPEPGGAIPSVSVYVVMVKNGAIRRMETGFDDDGYLPRVDWLPDSKQLAIEHLNRQQTKLELLIANVNNGNSRTVIHEQDHYWININNGPRFLGDGQRFLWSSERSGYRHLYLYDVNGRQISQLTTGEWEVSEIAAVNEKQNAVYFTATEKTPIERHLYRVNIDGSGFTRLTQGSRWHQVDFAPDGNSFIDNSSTAMQPPRQELVHIDGQRSMLLSRVASENLDDYANSPVEFLQIKTHDAITLDAMMIKPTRFDPKRKYPVIVYMGGGPRTQGVRNAWNGKVTLWHEMMAEKDFIIFALDNRGAAGHGHLFEEPVHFRLGAQELSDQREGIAYLRTLPYVDGKQIGTWGSGYGGQLVLHALFEDPQDFKAGFADSPIMDWRHYDAVFTERYLGLLQKHAEEYDESSPINRAGELKGRLLVAESEKNQDGRLSPMLRIKQESMSKGSPIETISLREHSEGTLQGPDAQAVLGRVTEFFESALQAVR